MYTILHASGALWRDTGVKYPDICWLKGKNVISPEDPLTIAPNSEGCPIWKKLMIHVARRQLTSERVMSLSRMPSSLYRGKHVWPTSCVPIVDTYYSLSSVLSLFHLGRAPWFSLSSDPPLSWGYGSLITASQNFYPRKNNTRMVNNWANLFLKTRLQSLDSSFSCVFPINLFVSPSKSRTQTKNENAPIHYSEHLGDVMDWNHIKLVSCFMKGVTF